MTPRVYTCQIMHGNKHISSLAGKLDYITKNIKRHIDEQGNKLTITVKPAKLMGDAVFTDDTPVLNTEYTIYRPLPSPPSRSVK